MGVLLGPLWATPGRGPFPYHHLGVWGTVLRLTPGTWDPEGLGVLNTPKYGVINGYQNGTRVKWHRIRVPKALQIALWGPYPR